jgi:hypothetical protein
MEEKGQNRSKREKSLLIDRKKRTERWRCTIAYMAPGLNWFGCNRGNNNRMRNVLKKLKLKGLVLFCAPTTRRDTSSRSSTSTHAARSRSKS